MINDNHTLLIDLWSRIKPFLPPKERLESADVFMTVFDEFGLVDETILSEELDRELRAAAKSRFSEIEEDDEDYGDEYDDYSSY